MLTKLNSIKSGFLLSVCVAIIAMLISSLIPGGIIGAVVIALLIGMALNPLINKNKQFAPGLSFTGKIFLRIGIVLMGVNMNFFQVLNVGKYSLFLMIFTMVTAFGAGNLIGKIFGLNWKLSNLLSVSTAICGGSAVAIVGPVIKARDEDIAYAISSTFIFDIVTVIIIPWIGFTLGMSNVGYGLWVGTAVNDTSSVVAAGYAFSEFAGNTAVIVKLTRTLFIIPYVIIFAIITKRLEAKSEDTHGGISINFKNIFPYFILFFVFVVALRSVDFIPNSLISVLSKTSKFFMVMALSSIGLKTSFKDFKDIGVKPIILGLSINILVLFVSVGILISTGRFN